MSKALKGALLCALVFPGLGQLALKSYARGVAFVAVTLACLAAIVGEAVQQAQIVLDRIRARGGAVDVDTISRAANEAVTGMDNRIVHAASLLLVVCWALSIVDGYRIGRKADTGRGRT
jgi:preprotein translocase subunit SecF